MFPVFHFEDLNIQNVLTKILSFFNKSSFKDTLNAFDDFKSKQQKCINSDVFWYVKVCIFWNRIKYTIHWDKTQILKKFPSDKINGTKNALLFLSRAATHHSFTFNLPFLYELKHKFRLSKTVLGIFHSWFHFVFIKVYTHNAWKKCIDLLTLKCHNSYQNENNGKVAHSFAVGRLIFKF